MMIFLWLCAVLADSGVIVAGLIVAATSYQDSHPLMLFVGLMAAAYGVRELGRLAFVRWPSKGGPNV